MSSSVSPSPSPSLSISSHRHRDRYRSKERGRSSRRRYRSRERERRNKNGGSNKQQLHNDYLIPWLKINGLLNDNKTTTDILNKCLPDIMKIYGGIKEILLFIVKHARYDTDINKLKSLNEIISKERRKTQNKNTSKIKNKDIESLPDECITHICSYLDKQNVISLKSTARKIGIVCLHEMRKKRIGIFNIEYNINFYQLNVKQMMQRNNYHSTKRFSYLYSIWSEQFNIPEQHQLIFENIRMLRRYSYPKSPCYGRGRDCNCNEPDKKIKYHTNHIELIDTESIRMNTINHKSDYFICDDRNVVILENTKGSKYNKVQNLENYQLILLEYFDIINQKIIRVQIILYRDKNMENKQCKDIFEYIEKGFISLNNMDNTWYYELQHILKQMNLDKNYGKLCIFQHKRTFPESRQRYYYDGNRKSEMNLIDTDYIQCNEFEEQLLTVQLNYEHPWFNGTNVFNKTKLHCTQNNDSFYLNADDFCANTINYNIKYKGDTSSLKSIVKYHYDLKLSTNKEENSIDIKDLNFVMEQVDKNCYIRMDKSAISGILRIKISKILFNNIIDPKYIELLDNFYRLYPWNQPLSILPSQYNKKNIYYGIVSYDTKSF